MSPLQMVRIRCAIAVGPARVVFGASWIVILPLLVWPLAEALGQARWPGVVAGLGAPLALIGWAAMAGFMADPQLMYNQPTGRSELLLRLAGQTGLDLTSAIPSFVSPFAGLDLDVSWLVAVLLLALAFTIWLGWRQLETPARGFVPTAAAA